MEKKTTVRQMRVSRYNSKRASGIGKKLLAVFLLFFLGTSGILSIDAYCKQTTGMGGKLIPDIKRTESGDMIVRFLGRETRFAF